MKIANKIFFLVLFFIVTLGISTTISLLQVADLGRHLRQIADNNIVLTEVGNTVIQRYLENAIRFQALLNAGDELAFLEISATRRQYLQSHVKSIKSGFDRLTQETGSAILLGKELIQKKQAQARYSGEQIEAQNAAELLGKIETAYVEYDQLFNEIFTMITKGNFELSMDDLAKINRKEKVLNQKIKSLLDEVHRDTRQTLDHALEEEREARVTLVAVLQGIVLVSLLMSFFIIRSFSGPLKQLVFSAQQIGIGNFKVELDTRRRDEIGEVSSAFNIMTKQLNDFKSKLEEQNKNLEKNLEVTQSQKKNIEKVNTELDRFVYTVSHDIAAPLTGIEGYGDYLEKHYFDKMDEKGQRSLTGLRRASKRMNAMIKDLLALTRISRIKNPYEQVDVNFLLNTVLEQLEYVIRENHARINILTPLPEIVCDRIKLTEIFVNLISNGIKFSSKTNATPLVEIGCVEQKECFEFYVRDNGIGIAPEHHREIFDIFKRLDNAADYEGTGAGLSIVKAGVEDQGGTISVESNIGQGATFRFTILKGMKATLSKHIVS